MSYLSISNLYKDRDILLFKECYALEKIHGSSAFTAFKDQKVHYHSGGATHTNFVAIFDNIEAKFKEHLVEQECKVFGEVYGGKMQAMSETYGKTLKFVVFDVFINECWLSVPQAEELVKNLGLEFVHYNKIPTTLEAIDAERDADSVQAVRNGCGTGKKREGVILRPLIELRKNNNERLICKHKRAEFMETKTPRTLNPVDLKILSDAKAVADEWVTPTRLQHVIDKIEKPWDITKTGIVVRAMVADVAREGAGEFIPSPEVSKEIGKKAAELYKAMVTTIKRD